MHIETVAEIPALGAIGQAGLLGLHRDTSFVRRRLSRTDSVLLGNVLDNRTAVPGRQRRIQFE